MQKKCKNVKNESGEIYGVLIRNMKYEMALIRTKYSNYRMKINIKYQG